MTRKQFMEGLTAGCLDGQLAALYGAGFLGEKKARLARALTAFEEKFGAGRELSVYSVPGRTELCGNHTDHQNGLVMSASISLDILAVAAKNEDSTIRVTSEGFGRDDVIDPADLAPRTEEEGHSPALVRGVAAAIRGLGGNVGGFDAWTTSDVLKGSGLSSSAAFEVCMGAILNGEYNEGRLSPVQLALAGQRAENKYFGKPSGLMDQLACAVGGAILIDLGDPAAPAVSPCGLDLEAMGLAMVVTDTGGSHSDLTEEYAAIRAGMEQVARYFGGDALRQVDEGEFYAAIPRLRADLEDLPVLRAIHFFAECHRVRALAAAIGAGDRARFLDILVEAGRSSFMYNQNVYSVKNPARQDVSLALALSERLLKGKGAWRIQGGGFAGTIQAFMPKSETGAYIESMEAVFGRGACHPLAIRESGAVRLLKL